MSKTASKEQKRAEEKAIAWYIPNLMGYVRFITILVSWKYAMTDPYTFIALYATSYLLGALDGTIARLLS